MSSSLLFALTVGITMVVLAHQSHAAVIPASYLSAGALGSPCGQSIITSSGLSSPLIQSILSASPGCGCGLSASPSIVAPSIASPVVSLVDDSISNNLANCLQLLVVSNLLGNTLPVNQGCLGGIVSAPLITSPAYLY